MELSSFLNVVAPIGATLVAFMTVIFNVLVCLPQTVSLDTSRFCTRGEWRLCGLRPQKANWAVNVSYGPCLPMVGGQLGEHAATDLTAAQSPELHLVSLLPMQQ